MAILKKKLIEFEFCRCWLHVEEVEELTRAALKRPPLVAEVVIVCLLSCSSILVAVHVVAFVVVTGSCTASGDDGENRFSICAIWAWQLQIAHFFDAGRFLYVIVTFISAMAGQSWGHWSAD